MSTAVFSRKPGSSRRASEVLTLAVFAILPAALAFDAFAEDFPFPEKDASAEFEKGFGEEKGLTQADKGLTERDRLKIGGALWSEFNYLYLDSDQQKDGYISNPNSLWFYLDSQLNNDVRGLAKFRSIYDPTVSAASPNPLTGVTGAKTRGDIEELKLLFSVKKRVFFTVGKQKVKWGSGKFWNPTDFLNSDRRNFFYSTDLRSGVSQIKTHVPVGDANFYLVNGLDDADGPTKISNAVRAEVPVGRGEIAVSARARKGSRPVYGLDVSTAVWELDAYGEIAYSDGSGQTRFDSAGVPVGSEGSVVSYVGGLSYEAVYSDQDSVTFGVEYFRNGLGYDSAGPYPFVLAAGQYQPFYLGRQYGMISVLLPNPGDWNHVTFTLFNVMNLSDQSAVTRLDTLYTGLDDLSMGLALGAHYGKNSGELKFGSQVLDVGARLMIQF